MTDNTFANDVKKAIPFIKSELKKNNIVLEEKKLIKFTETMLKAFYGKGGWYDEYEIRKFTNSYMQIIIHPIIQDELLKNNIVMEERDIWFFTKKVIDISHKNGGGASEFEIRQIVKECIDNEIYKEYLGYAEKLNNRIIPISGTTKK